MLYLSCAPLLLFVKPYLWPSIPGLPDTECQCCTYPALLSWSLSSPICGHSYQGCRTQTEGASAVLTPRPSPGLCQALSVAIHTKAAGHTQGASAVLTPRPFPGLCQSLSVAIQSTSKGRCRTIANQNEHWNCFKNNIADTSEIRVGALTGFPMLSRTEVDCTRTQNTYWNKYLTHTLERIPMWSPGADFRDKL